MGLALGVSKGPAHLSQVELVEEQVEH